MVDFAGVGSNTGARIGLDPAHSARLQMQNAAQGAVPTALSSAVAAASAGDKTRTDTGPGGNDSTGLARKSRGAARNEASARSAGPDGSAAQGRGAAPERPLREDMLTGPPPTFEATLLELETDLKLALARIQAAGYGAATPPGEVPSTAGAPAVAAGKPGTKEAAEAKDPGANAAAAAHPAQAAPEGDRTTAEDGGAGQSPAPQPEDRG